MKITDDVIELFKFQITSAEQSLTKLKQQQSEVSKNITDLNTLRNTLIYLFKKEGIELVK